MEQLKFDDSTMSCKSASSILGREDIALASGECTSSCPGKQVQARITTPEDLPDYLLESILKRLPLLKYYQHRYSLGTGWASFMSPSFHRTSPLPRPWFFKGIQRSPPMSTLGLDGQTGTVTTLTNHYDVSLNFCEPESGKEDEIHVRDHLVVTRPGSSVSAEQPGGTRTLAAVGQGLLFFLNGPEEHVWRETRAHVMPLLYVLNPVNGSKRILPSVPAYNSHDVKSDYRVTRWTPLKLVVDLRRKVDPKSGESSPYKCYLMQDEIRYKENSLNSKLLMSISYRIIVYDSTLDAWVLTGMEWECFQAFGPVRSGAPTSLFDTLIQRIDRFKDITQQIFPMNDGSSYISAGFPNMQLTKYHNCAFVDTIMVPFVIRPCTDDFNCGCNSLEFCGCISTAIFQSEGKIVFFKQTSWKGPFGPNCISVTLWELDKKAMAWQEQVTLPTHRFEVYHPTHSDEEIRRLDRTDWIVPIIFRYDGMLLVAHSHLRLIAALDISKKTWCKVPQTLLETTAWYSKTNIHAGNHYDVDRLLFQPSCHARA